MLIRKVPNYYEKFGTFLCEMRFVRVAKSMHFGQKEASNGSETRTEDSRKQHPTSKKSTVKPCETRGMRVRDVKKKYHKPHSLVGYLHCQWSREAPVSAWLQTHPCGQCGLAPFMFSHHLFARLHINSGFLSKFA